MAMRWRAAPSACAVCFGAQIPSPFRIKKGAYDSAWKSRELPWSATLTDKSVWQYVSDHSLKGSHLIEEGSRAGLRDTCWTTVSLRTGERVKIHSPPSLSPVPVMQPSVPARFGCPTEMSAHS
eukprot:6204956-Pleurochrysis_carterae.AAC.2